MSFPNTNGVASSKEDVSQGHEPEARFAVSFPQKNDSSFVHQDEEFTELIVQGKPQRIRVHDYQTMFAQQGLYEYIIHEQLECDSPRILVQLLQKHLTSGVPDLPSGPLRILDVAAGNGIVGAELRKQLGDALGVESLVGTDLLESARTATIRDRPGVYDDFVIADLARLDELEAIQLKENWFSVVTICAALGPGKDDLPLEAFDSAIGLLRMGGLLAFTVNERNNQPSHPARWRMFLEGIDKGGETHWKNMQEIEKQKYRHRKNVQGKWIEYTALIYQKIETSSV